MASYSLSTVSKIMLVQPTDWPDRFFTYRNKAKDLSVLDYIDPNDPTDFPPRPFLPTKAKWLENYNANRDHAREPMPKLGLTTAEEAELKEYQDTYK